MSSGTLPGNLNLIRNDPYGPTVREAIASAIEQADASIDSKIADIRSEVNDECRMSVEKISGTDDDYILIIENPA